MTFRVKEVNMLLATIIETQPKQSSGGTGRTREDIVMEKAEDLLSKMPADYVPDSYRGQIQRLGGLEVPLNIFLFQEVERFQRVVKKTRFTLTVLMQAIRGEVVMTPELLGALNAMFDALVPETWLFTPGGDEFSWLSPTLGLWFSSLVARNEQYRGWLDSGRPSLFWMTGFSNPQGFLTAMRQEVTRRHKADKWALDEMVFHNEVLEQTSWDKKKPPPKEGVLIRGLYLDGCGWSRTDHSLVESEPKQLFAAVPLLFVTAVTKQQHKTKATEFGPFGGYSCPCYKYPSRNDRNLIFLVSMATRELRPEHWVMRGVALLCSTD
jgi:dynein heavy chain